MVRLLVCLLAMTLLGSSGCALFDKKSDKDGSAKNAPKTNGKPPSYNDDPLRGPTGQYVPPPAANPFGGENELRAASAANPGGILAGQVVDDLGRPQDKAEIDWVSLDTKDKGSISVQPGGYFIIPGLKQGGQYKLIARAKNGEQMLAGQTYASVPDGRMRITIDRRYAGPDTPPLSGPPAFQSGGDKTKTSGVTPASDWNFGGDNNIAPVSMEPELPVVMRIPSPAYAPQPATASNPPTAPGWSPPNPNAGWAPSTPSTSWPPPAEIRGPQIKASEELQKPWPTLEIQKPVAVPPPSPVDPPPPMFPESGGMSLEAPPGGSSRIPFCAWNAGRLQNFGLNDINGQPWEFRQHHGKVVLLDFWGTFCMPCRQTMPKLRDLHNRFGSKLEIIGIAYERDGSPQEQAHRIHALCQSMQVGHRQLLGGGTSCPVAAQFRVTGFPTLILLDDSGAILWRCDGLPDRGAMEELERRIFRQVNP